jgi:hypothetical protein
MFGSFTGPRCTSVNTREISGPYHHVVNRVNGGQVLRHPTGAAVESAHRAFNARHGRFESLLEVDPAGYRGSFLSTGHVVELRHGGPRHG